MATEGVTTSTVFVKREACPACGGTSYQTIRELPFGDSRVWDFVERQYGGRVPRAVIGEHSYAVAECAACGLLFQQYILDDEHMFQLYEHWISAEESLASKRHASALTFRKCALEVAEVAKFAGKPPHQIQLLEYGMGWAQWLLMAQAHGYQVTGVELSELRIQHARRHGLRVVSSLSELEPESQDHIYSSQVFEHLPDPLGTLRDLAGVLRPGGVIHLLVPDGEGFARKLRRPDWKAAKDAVQPLEHINCYTGRSMRALAERAGLRLRSPIYRPRPLGVGAFLKSQFQWLRDRRYGTKVYLTK